MKRFVVALEGALARAEADLFGALQEEASL